MMDHRLAERFHTHFKVNYLPLKSPTYKPIYTLSNDISETGINVDLNSGIDPGDLLELNIFSSQNENTIKTKARIVWMQKPNPEENLLFKVSGLQFIDIDNTQKMRLRKFIKNVDENSKVHYQDEFFEDMSLLCKATHSRESFIRESEYRTKRLFNVINAHVLLPEKIISEEKRLVEWVGTLKIMPSNLIVPLISNGCLVGQLELGEKVSKNGFSSRDLARLKYWAACLATLTWSLYASEIKGK